jgi:hypothetical protein
MTNDGLAMQHTELTRFLFDAKDHGYADIQRGRPTAERDHSLTMGCESGDWRFHDNFFGGEPYGGRAELPLRGPEKFSGGPSCTAWPSTAPSKSSGVRRPFTETAVRSMRPASPADSSTGGVASDGTYPRPPTRVGGSVRRFKVEVRKYREVERKPQHQPRGGLARPLRRPVVRGDQLSCDRSGHPDHFRAGRPRV